MKVVAVAFVVLGTIIAIGALVVGEHPAIALLGSGIAALALMVHAAADDQGTRW